MATKTIRSPLILKDFLTAHKAEVIGMFLTEYNEEEARKCMREESYEEGLEEGVDKSIKTLAWLQKQNRNEDMLKAISDKDYMTQVIKEYEETNQ